MAFRLSALLAFVGFLLAPYGAPATPPPRGGRQLVDVVMRYRGVGGEEGVSLCGCAQVVERGDYGGGGWCGGGGVSIACLRFLLLFLLFFDRRYFYTVPIFLKKQKQIYIYI